MRPVPVTTLPDNAEALTDTVYLDKHRGKVVEITTESGSTYWVVPTVTGTKFARSGVICIRGLSITTNSKSVGRFTSSPSELEAVNTIETGKPWRFGDKGSTTNVVSVRVVG